MLLSLKSNANLKLILCGEIAWMLGQSLSLPHSGGERARSPGVCRACHIIPCSI